MKKQKKKRLRVGRLLLVLLVIAVISFACYKFLDVPIMSIIIKGNNVLKDQEIIEQSKLQDYPSYFSTFSFAVKNRLKQNPYVKSVKVSKGLLNVKISIEEKKILYVDKAKQEIVTEDGVVKDKRTVCVPYLTNQVPDDKKRQFVKGMSKINDDILCQMSEIKYDPNDIDSDRYYVFMNDGNGVYLTVNKFDKINKYNTILENIGKQNGILYLDYGDYFEVK
ncbi:MAG: FtsQ-type POTRA domain-containing protein [Bacilli bacterium]|nr:FtsQ-type POTRA domain-containing protein [Bacilli bacterium]